MLPDKQQVEETISALKQQRDELALKIHLGNMEAQADFEKATEKLQALTQDFEPLKTAVQDSAENVLAALGLVGDEVRSSFDRIRKSLS
jgi:hypothetical protein